VPPPGAPLVLAGSPSFFTLLSSTRPLLFPVLVPPLPIARGAPRKIGFLLLRILAGGVEVVEPSLRTFPNYSLGRPHARRAEGSFPCFSPPPFPSRLWPTMTRWETHSPPTLSSRKTMSCPFLRLRPPDTPRFSVSLFSEDCGFVVRGASQSCTKSRTLIVD